jgi:hypothetical protein
MLRAITPSHQQLCLCAGYQSEDKGVAFELVQKAGAQEIEIGSGFRHFSVAVPSIEGALQRAMDAGYEIVEGEGFEAGEIYIRVTSCNVLMSPNLRCNLQQCKSHGETFRAMISLCPAKLT